MAFNYPEIRSFQGLYLQRNSFDLPDGFLEEATNTIVSRDNILSKRRGSYEFYNPPSGTINKLFNYQEKLISSYTDKVAYYTDTGTAPNQTGTQTVLTGETVSITSPRVSRSIQGNNNFYFTTDNGPLKLTAYNSAVSNTGAPPGLDMTSHYIVGSQSTFLGSGNIVGYRVVFGYTDANGNLILGAPSDISTIGNTFVENKTGTRSGAGPYTISVASIAHGLTTGMYLNFTLHSGSSFDSDAVGIYQITVVDSDNFTYEVASAPSPLVTNKSGTRSGSGPYTITVVSTGHGLITGTSVITALPSGSDFNSNAAGTFSITAIDGDTFSYSVASAPSNTVTNKTGTRSGLGPYVITVASTAHGLDAGAIVNFSLYTGSTFNTNAEGSYPITVINANSFSYIVQNDPGAATGALSYFAETGLINYTAQAGSLDYCYAMPVQLEFSIPSTINSALPWFYQVYRSSQQQISVGVFSDFKLLNQVNLSNAEMAAEFAFFTDDYEDVLLGAELYTNENSREGELQANFQPPLCEDVTFFKGYAIYGACTTKHILNLALIDSTALGNNDYLEFKIGTTIARYIARTGAGNQTLTGLCSSSSGLLVTFASHGFSNGDKLYISSTVGGSLAAGYYFVVSSAANTFKLSLTSGGAPVAYNSETSLVFQGVTNGTYPIFYLSQSSSAAVRLRDTAEGLVKAVNRDSTGLLYAQYTSGLSDIPGKMRFQAKGYGDAIYARANSGTAGSAFSPVLPDSFSVGSQVFSSNDQLPNGLYISKYSEPEAVPLVNFLLVGSKNKPIYRIHALRDSIIVLKSDGVWRVTGDNLNNFAATLLDGTVFIVAPSSSDVLNNQVVFLSNQGVCLVTESSVQIISRNIEDVIQPILGQADLSLWTSGVAYETERLYIMTTTTPNDPTASNVYVYNFLTTGWTSWTSLFSQAVIGPGDKLYYLDLANNIQRERKNQTKLDYAGQNYAASVSNVASDKLSCEITVSVGIPEIGDVLVLSSVINRIYTAPVFITGSTYSVTFSEPCNLVNGDNAVLYKKITSRVKFAPFHAGLVGKMKHFSEVQFHLRESSLSRATLTFSGDTYGTSQSVTWKTVILKLGWGYFDWGYEPFGQTEVIELTAGTRPAPIIRTLIPQMQARNTFIQTILVHDEAAEQLNIQSLSFAVRPYGGRVSR